MKKLLSVVLAATIFIAPLTTHAATYQPLSPQSGYNYDWVDQSAHPTLNPGQSAILWVKLKNTGTTIWSLNDVFLGTSREHDRSSSFINHDPRARWASPNRIKLDVTSERNYSVQPGEIGSFGFYIQVPADTPNGTYREYFQPVREGIGWMKDVGIYWDITVTGGTTQSAPTTPSNNMTPAIPRISDYRYEIVSQSPQVPLQLSHNTPTLATLRLRNTGSATWYKTGPNPVRLRAGSQHDTARGNRDASWSTTAFSTRMKPWIADGGGNYGRIEMEQDSVAPGQIASFTIPFLDQGSAPRYDQKIYFTPILEGIDTMQDIGIYWNILFARDEKIIGGEDLITEEDINISEYNPLSLWVDREYVTYGQSTTLYWGINPFVELFLEEDSIDIVRNYLNAYVTCTVDQGIGTVTGKGSKVIANITANTIFHMTCYDSKKGISHSTRDDDTPAIITIVPYIPAKIPSLTATPQPNGNLVIQWTDMGATADYYTLTYSDDANFAKSGDGMVASYIILDENSLTFEKGDLEPNTTYYFKVEYYSADPAVEGVLSEASQTLTYRTSN